jgi:hypothetical protein
MNNKYFETVFLKLEQTDEFPESFAIVTACNPMDQILSQADNGKRNQKLLDTLNSRGQYLFPIIGSSPDLTHQEPSLIMHASRPEALELGIRFGQRAIFWVSKDLLEIIECATGKRHPVGSFRKRIRKANC